MSNSNRSHHNQQQQPQKTLSSRLPGSHRDHQNHDLPRAPTHHHFELTINNPLPKEGEATNSADELSKWGGTIQPLTEDTNKKHPKNHHTSTSIQPTKDKVSNQTVSKLVSKVMSHTTNVVNEEDDLGGGRSSSMESEGLKGYVETHSIGVGIAAKEETMLLVDLTPDGQHEILSPRARKLREELRAESEMTSVHISQKLELMRDEEEQRRNNRNDIGIANQDSMRMSEVYSPTDSAFNQMKIKFQQKKPSQSPWSLYLYQPPINNQQDDFSPNKNKQYYYQLQRFNNKKMPVLRQGSTNQNHSPLVRGQSVKTDRSNTADRVSIQFDPNTTPLIVPVMEETMQDSIFFGTCNNIQAKINNAEKQTKEIKYHQIKLELPFASPERDYSTNNSMTFPESAQNNRRKLFSRKQNMNQINEKHDSMPISQNAAFSSNMYQVADSPNRVQAGVTGVKATLQTKSRSPSINKRRAAGAVSGQGEAENSSVLVPPLLITDQGSATKNKEELFLVEDNPGKEDYVETQRRSFDKTSSIVIRAAAPIIDYTSVLRDQIHHKNGSFRNLKSNLNRATSNNRSKSPNKSKDNSSPASPKSPKGQKVVKTIILSNHAGITTSKNPFNNLAMTLKIKQFHLSNLNQTMIQYMEQSNKNSSNDDFNISKEGYTLGDISQRESTNGAGGEISHEDNTPQHHALMQNQQQQILVKDQIVNNAFKANDRRMPFAHFQTRPQIDIRPIPKTGKITPKPDYVIVGTQSPRINPSPPKNGPQQIHQGTSGIPQDDPNIPQIQQRPKGVDRSMQMSISFGGVFTQAGSVHQSLVTVGDQRIGTGTIGENFRSGTSRQFSRGRQNFQGRAQSSAMKDEGDQTGIIQKDSPGKQSKMFQNGYDLTPVMQESFEVQSPNPFLADKVAKVFTPSTELIKPDSAEVKFNEDGFTKSSQSQRKNVFHSRGSGTQTPQLGSIDYNEKITRPMVNHIKSFGRNQLNVQSIQEEDTKKTITSHALSIKEPRVKISKVQKELKIVRHIYDNFEKHPLPIRDPKIHLQKLNLNYTILGDNREFLNKAKETLINEKYKKYHGHKYMHKEEFYRGDSMTGFQSGEIRKKTDNDEYYTMRAEYNKIKYLEMLNNKVMEIDVHNQISPKSDHIKKISQTPQLAQSAGATQYQGFGGVSTMRDTGFSIGTDGAQFQEIMRNTHNSFISSVPATQLQSPQSEYQDQPILQNELSEYNRFAHLLQFKTDQKIKRADVININRNEALIKIREKIKNRSIQGAAPLIERTTQQTFQPRVFSQETSPRHITSHKAKTSMSLQHNPKQPVDTQHKTPAEDPYGDYLANKTTLLPLLNQQVTLLKEDIVMQDTQRKLNQTQQQWKKRTSKDAIHANTLLHMKMQPRLRVSEFDYTQEKLDLKMIKEGKRRNKREERERLMGGKDTAGVQDDVFSQQGTQLSQQASQRKQTMPASTGPAVLTLDSFDNTRPIVPPQSPPMSPQSQMNREFTMSMMNMIAGQMI